MPRLVINYLIAALITGLTICACSCTPNRSVGGPLIPGPDVRGVTNLILIGADAHGLDTPEPAPCRVALLVDISAGESDDDRTEYVSKVEIDLADGNGWTDITAFYRENWSPSTSIPNPCYEYYYTEPGTYTIRARVTYWDGEVVYDTPISFMEDSQTVTVLPPTDSA